MCKGTKRTPKGGKQADMMELRNGKRVEYKKV